jgi:5-methylcytosine-specific restriction endonuclease McrA
MPTINTLRKQLHNKNLRAKVFAKTDGTCWYCEARFADDYHPPEIDHVYPISLGGTNEIDNLVPCCYLCNTRKGNRVSV